MGKKKFWVTASVMQNFIKSTIHASDITNVPEAIRKNNMLPFF
jgi:hypothetical protein